VEINALASNSVRVKISFFKSMAAVQEIPIIIIREAKR
jgi:hypothetical protein